MTKRFLYFILSFNVFAGMAQTDTSHNVLDEVIVTANKFYQKQSSTGKVITVISKDEINRNSGRTLSALLNDQAGITINGALQNLGSNQTVYMRGAASGRTLILVDGIPISDPSFINNDFDLNLLSLNNIERIEIGRGAQSTLYGSDAIAGVINIITVKKDITKPVNVKATVATGSFKTFRGNVQVYGKAGKLTYNAGYSKLATKGFSAAYDSTGANHFDKDGYNGDVLNASVQYALSAKSLIRTFGQYSRYKTDLDASQFTDETDYTSTNKLFRTGVSYQYTTDAVSLVANYQYSDNHRYYLNDSLDKPSFTTYSSDDYYGKSQFFEVYTNIGLNDNFKLLTGADYRFNNMNSSYYSESSFGPYASSFNDTSHSQSSLYASLFFQSSNKRLHVEAGGRLNVHSRYGSNHTFTINPSYNFSDNFRLFASYATGYKAPTLYQLFSGYGNQALQPERSKNWEFGLQHVSKVTNIRAVYFNRVIDDGIDFDNLGFQYFNYIQQKAHGVELEAIVKPVEKLAVNLNYTYIRPTELSQSRESFKDTTYQFLLRRPAHSANVSLAYAFNNHFNASITGKYVGNRYDAGGYMSPDILLKKYFLISAYAAYQLNGKFKVFADAQNIANTRFFDVRGYNSIPFTMVGGVTVEL